LSFVVRLFAVDKVDMMFFHFQWISSSGWWRVEFLRTLQNFCHLWV